ncbi:MAG: hypothetical protein HGA26_00305 [Chlorobiaceae bacterium]|nr:hypothetical protein [Chlorobiaceae bacterium]
MHKRSIVRLAGASLAIFVVCGTLSSCQKKVGEVLVEKAIEQSTGNKVDIRNGGQNVTIQSEGQKIEIQSNTSGVWPNDIPGEVPKFAYGQIKAVTRSDMPEGKSWVVISENVPGNIIKSYESLLKNSGFKTVSTIITSDEGEGGSVSGEKDQLKVALITGNGSASLSVVKEP